MKKINLLSSKYFVLGDFKTTIEVESPTYGKYTMTHVMTIDMISAWEDKKLIEAYDLYDIMRDKIFGSKSIKIKSKLIGDTFLHKFEVYTPLKQDNTEWVATKPYFKNGKLPVAYDRDKLIITLKKLIGDENV